MSSDGQPLKRKRRRRLLTAALVVLSLLTVTISVLFVFRFDLWRDHAGIRWVVLPLILADPSVRGSSKVELRLLLGPPDVIEGRYCWFPRELGQMTGDLRFDIGDSNDVTQIRFVWRDWKPTAEMPIDLESWKDQPEAGRWAMNADLVRRWPSGAFRREIETVTDVLRYFPGAVFIDCWQFASDGGGGLGGSLDFEFEADGRVKDVRCGYID